MPVLFRRFLLAACAVVGLAMPTRAALVGHWTFDNTLNDATANANNGSFNGSPTPAFSADVSPVLGSTGSLSFGGSTGRVVVPDSNSLDISSALTISAWVKPVGPTGFDGILAKNPSSNGSAINHAGNYEFRIENSSRRLSFHYQKGGVSDTTAFVSSGVVATNAWQHVAVTAQAGGQINLYINGVNVGSTATLAGFGAINTNPLYIGSRADNVTVMNGLLDDVRLYDNALTPTDVFLLANPNLDPGTPYPGIPNILARASSNFTGDGRLAQNAVNGNGLINRLHVVNPPGGNMWLTDGVDTNPTFEMDLGHVHTVNELRVWNYNENANATCCLGRGIHTADIYVAGADGVYGATPVIQGAEFLQAPGTISDFSQVVNLGGVDARYVKFANITNHGDPQFTGLSEVKVVGTSQYNALYPIGKAPLPASIKSVSSNLAGFNRRAEYLVNRVGMEFGDAHTTIPDGNMWLSQGTFGGGPADLAPEVTFDLGQVTTLSHMKVWNYYEYRPDLGPVTAGQLMGRGVQIANILIAGEDMVFTPWIEYQEFSQAPFAFNAGDFSQRINMNFASARYVKFQILYNFNGKDFTDPLSLTDGAADFAGLSEVQFFTVPEPSTSALVVLGSVVAAGVARRRRRSC